MSNDAWYYLGVATGMFVMSVTALKIVSGVVVPKIGSASGESANRLSPKKKMSLRSERKLIGPRKGK